MARPSNKEDLIMAMDHEFEVLLNLLNRLTPEQQIAQFNFEQLSSRKEAHWTRDKNIRDVLIHLYEWHQLIINWVEKNQNGQAAKFLPDPYNWRSYGEMNIMFFEKHQKTTYDEALSLLKQSHSKVRELAMNLSNNELFKKDSFSWTGNVTLGSYFVSSTSSHYAWANKKIRAYIKQLNKK